MELQIRKPTPKSNIKAPKNIIPCENWVHKVIGSSGRFIMTLEILALGAALTVIALIFVYTLKTGISPMPTSTKVRHAMLEILPADLNGPILELGSGWGTLAVPLAHKYSKSTVIGYEISPLPWVYSYIRKLTSNLQNLTFYRRDYLKEDLSDAALIVVYIHADGMEKLRTKLECELKPGALVQSNFFQIRGWTPIRELIVDDVHQTKIYLYRR